MIHFVCVFHLIEYSILLSSVELAYAIRDIGHT